MSSSPGCDRLASHWKGIFFQQHQYPDSSGNLLVQNKVVTIHLPKISTRPLLFAHRYKLLHQSLKVSAIRAIKGYIVRLNTCPSY